MKVTFELRTPYGASQYKRNIHSVYKNIVPRQMMWDWRLILSYICNNDITIVGFTQTFSPEGDVIDTKEWTIYKWPARKIFEENEKYS